MKNYILLWAVLLGITACKSNQTLTEVKTPFKGNAYESNNRWFRATGSGESMNQETSKDKAMLTAKQRLAAAIQTQIKQVSENYKGERMVGEDLGDFNERFQQLTREVMNQVLVDVRVVEEKTYMAMHNHHYITWVAMEARKRDVYKRLKELAAARSTLSDKDKAYLKHMLDEALKELPDED